MWRIYRYGRWRDYLMTAALLTLLFYTHLLGFLIAFVMFAVTTAMVLRHDRAIGKILTTASIVGACAAPWVLFTGFLDQRADLPPARAFLSFPADLIYYPLARIPYLILPLLGLIWLAIVFLFHKH